MFGLFYCNWKEGENADDQEVDDADDDDGDDDNGDDDDDDAPAGGRVE